jgi:membrane protease YdiL (CAAX protease family)
MSSFAADSIVVTPPQASFAQRIPRWQVVLVLVGFPALYMVNSFMPWSLNLFGWGDRSWYLPFMASVVVLHWLTTIVMVALVHRSGGTLSDIGLTVSPSRILAAVAVFMLLGGAFLWLRTTWPIPAEPPSGWQALYPFTWTERVVMLLVAATAGICEEMLYRGFALRTLRGRGMALWLALLLSGFSFALIHGFAGIIMLPVFLVVHALFAAIFLWRKSLWPVIYLHVLWDMLMVLAV